MRTIAGMRPLRRFRYVLLLVVLAAVVAAATPADAQTLLRTLGTPNPQAYGLFGVSVAVGDVNGDRKGDVVVGAAQENGMQGRAYVFSGTDGSLLFTLDAPNPQSTTCFGCYVAVGDVNGDQKGDIAVGSPQELTGGKREGRVYVFSGADGSLLLTLNDPDPQPAPPWGFFGSPVAVGDVNGDGKGEVAVGATGQPVGGNSRQGRAYVFSGADGSLLFTLDTPNPGPFRLFGSSLAVGDVNGDGEADIAVGAYGERRTYVFSGVDQLLLFTLNAPDPQVGVYFGWSVAVGDVNGDGKGDIAVGDYGESANGNSYQGRAYVFSGADGSLLRTLDTPNPQANAEFGYSLAVGDVNGDGKGDIVVGADGETVGGNTRQGRAYLFSGASGSVRFTLDTPNPQAYAYFGWSVAVGDVDGDGKGDITVGAPLEDVGGNDQQGRAYVFSPPMGVGGIQALPDSAASSGDSSALPYVALACVAAAGVAALGLGGWYVGRRQLR